jgi:hypothetical protein
MSEEPEKPESTELALKIEKLRLEISELKQSQVWNHRGIRFTPLITAFVAVLAFLFTVQQFVTQQKEATLALERQTLSAKMNSERAFMQPVLQRQMNLYFEASSVAATIASTQDKEDKAKALDSF